MSTSRIDFAPPSLLRALTRAHPVAWLAGVAGLAACIGAGVQGYRLDEQSARLQAALQTLHAQQARAAAPATQGPPVTEAQAGAINAVAARLNLPWRDLFRTIEAATPPDRIALLELSPDPSRRAVKGSAEARNAEDMLAYVTKLGEQPFFASVSLVRHEVNEQDPNRPLRFQFVAEWRDLPANAAPLAAVAASLQRSAP